MQFSVRYDEERWMLNVHEKEVAIVVIYWEINAKISISPIDTHYNKLRNPHYCWGMTVNDKRELKRL